MKRFRWLLVLMAVCGLLLAATQAAPGPEETARRATAQKLMRDGNWQEAYTEFSAFATDRETDPQQVANDLSQAVHCLQRLGRIDEFDEFIEKSIAAHEENWRLLHRAAQLYMDAQHRGVIIAGKFVRGPHRGGTGKRVNSFERDRVRSLQLLEEALPLVAENKSAKAEVTWQLAQTLLANRGYSEAWRLQYLTDIKTLPDYEEGYYGWYGRSSRGAPVHPDGTPVFHALAETWNDAKTDGERWRWALQYDAERRKATLRHFADFHHNQFGVQTMAQDRWFWRGSQPEDGSRENESGTYALHTLKETETIARLANGIKRFSLPDEFNFVLMYKELAETEILAQIFENRRQYPRAADYWRTTIARNGPGHDNYRQKRLDQIIQNWGMFEPVMTQPAGQGATVEFRFRNGKKVNFVAYEIDIEKLLADVKDYLKSSPPKLNWEQINISDLGYRLVRKNQRQYVGNKVAEWSLDLDPLPNHFDRRITVTTPLQKAGAYLVTADMDAGNTTNIVLWVADTAIVQKPLEGKPYYFVADAVTGKPIPKANLEFFGYRQERVEDAVGRGVRYRVLTENFAEQTDNDGQLFTRTLDRQYQWVIVARTPEGRLAYLGFSHIWSGRYREAEYNQRKTFLITDRPVYRPGHDVKFKFWVNHAKYDQEGKSSFAGRSFKVIAKNPRNETVFEKSFVADEFGGINGEFTLGKEATLGNYQLYIEHFGGGSFRVEEYKKPEFEVTVDAPSEPVMLGEKTTAKISANYYFGAPVTEAKVKYKVLRSEHSADWYPIGLWDWFYEPGYWWFAYDYTWYPGWREWGCPRPVPFWWGWRPQPQPELVAEVEVPIGEDGTVNVEIDTAIAKELMGDVDHRYQITAEVTDLSRRTIVGQGAVLVARKPFKVFAWVNRGHYRVGDTIHANFKAHTLAGKPVEGKGLLRLLRISYDENKQPVETEVQQWDLDTNDEGRSHIQMTAARAGQYRLSYQVTDAKDHTIEGGYVFVIRGAGFDGSAFRFNAIELVTDKREYQPGETVNLMINTEQPDSTVVLFVRPSNGVYLPPKILRLRGKSTVEDIAVVKKDMPNFFVEAFTVANGKVYSETREVIVPPESRVLDV